MLIDNRERTLEEVYRRMDTLAAWNALVEATWGDAEVSERYAGLRFAVFGDNGDPEDDWNNHAVLAGFLAEWVDE